MKDAPCLKDFHPIQVLLESAPITVYYSMTLTWTMWLMEVKRSLLHDAVIKGKWEIKKKLQIQDFKHSMFVLSK